MCAYRKGTKDTLLRRENVCRRVACTSRQLVCNSYATAGCHGDGNPAMILNRQQFARFFSAHYKCTLNYHSSHDMLNMHKAKDYQILVPAFQPITQVFT